MWVIVANSCRGILMPVGESIYKFSRLEIPVLLSSSNRIAKSKRFSPSKTLPITAPEKPIDIILLISSICKPYLATFFRSYTILICGKPAIFSTEISEAPSTFSINFLISFPFLLNTFKSSPNILIAISALTPVINSLKRISIGWVNSTSIPGIIARASLNLSASSSLVLAETHSLFGFNLMITSLSSIDMGSVGISAAPILLTT